VLGGQPLARNARQLNCGRNQPLRRRPTARRHVAHVRVAHARETRQFALGEVGRANHPEQRVPVAGARYKDLHLSAVIT
jgi:hypothetical protein